MFIKLIASLSHINLTMPDLTGIDKLNEKELEIRDGLMTTREYVVCQVEDLRSYWIR